jgi:hypothetical protein
MRLRLCGRRAFDVLFDGRDLEFPLSGLPMRDQGYYIFQDILSLACVSSSSSFTPPVLPAVPDSR